MWPQMTLWDRQAKNIWLNCSASKLEEGKEINFNTCCDIVHGIRSPEARLPRDRLLTMDDLDISPSKQTCMTKTMYLLLVGLRAAARL